VSGPRRHVLLTPGLDGADGIAAVSREALRALAEDGTPVEVWSLARTSRARFAAWGAAAALRGGRGVHVLSMHLRLAPVALPLVVRGARVLARIDSCASSSTSNTTTRPEFDPMSITARAGRLEAGMPRIIGTRRRIGGPIHYPA